MRGPLSNAGRTWAEEEIGGGAGRSALTGEAEERGGPGLRGRFLIFARDTQAKTDALQGNLAGCSHPVGGRPGAAVLFDAMNDRHRDEVTQQFIAVAAQFRDNAQIFFDCFILRHVEFLRGVFVARRCWHLSG